MTDSAVWNQLYVLALLLLGVALSGLIFTILRALPWGKDWPAV